MIDEIVKKIDEIAYMANEWNSATQIFETKVVDYSDLMEILAEQLNNGWIPTSERLPEETKDYLCTVEWYGTATKKLLIDNGYKIEKRIKMVHFLDSNKSFKECDGFCTYKVIAWKHEEPYKAD